MTPARRLADAVAAIAEATAARTPTGTGHDDADDVVGTIATDDAVGFDPRPVLAALHAAGVRAVVIGQVAGILHGSEELTGDLDLLWSGEPHDAAAMAGAFAALAATLTDDDGVALPVEPATFLRPKVQYRTATASGDCCTPALPWGRLDVASMLGSAVTATVDGVALHYVRRDHLVAMRRAVGRPKDLRRADELDRLANSGSDVTPGR